MCGDGVCNGDESYCTCARDCAQPADYVDSGLFQVTGDSDALLAVVLGHEVAHALAHHASERIYRSEMTARALRVLGGGLGALGGGEQDRLIGLLSGLSSLKLDRKQESEADHIGLLYMARAGYDPRESITFWQRMEQSSRGQPPEFLSDHPSHGTRIQQLNGWMPQALDEFQRHRTGG